VCTGNLGALKKLAVSVRYVLAAKQDAESEETEEVLAEAVEFMHYRVHDVVDETGRQKLCKNHSCAEDNGKNSYVSKLISRPEFHDRLVPQTQRPLSQSSKAGTDRRPRRSGH